MFKFRIWTVLLAILSAILLGLSAKYKGINAFVYTELINKFVREKMSVISNKTALPISEIILIIIVIMLLIVFINFIRNLFSPKKWIVYVARLFWGTFNIFSILLFIYIVVFGLNYQTPTLGDELVQKYNTRFSTNVNVNIDSSKRMDLFKQLSEKASESKKVFVSSEKKYFDNLDEMYLQAEVGYNVISEAFPKLSGKYSRPKESLSNDMLNYFGLDGTYSMLMNEIVINTSIPKEYMPFILCKYMAYQRGVAREDEASFYAYLSCINNPDIRFKYAGYLAMTEMIIESLRSNDKIDFNLSFNTLDKEIKTDVLKLEAYKGDFGSGKKITYGYKFYFKRINGDVRVDSVANQATNLISIYYSLFPTV